MRKSKQEYQKPESYEDAKKRVAELLEQKAFSRAMGRRSAYGCAKNLVTGLACMWTAFSLAAQTGDLKAVDTLMKIGGIFYAKGGVDGYTSIYNYSKARQLNKELEFIKNDFDITVPEKLETAQQKAMDHKARKTRFGNKMAYFGTMATPFLVGAVDTMLFRYNDVSPILELRNARILGAAGVVGAVAGFVENTFSLFKSSWTDRTEDKKTMQSYAEEFIARPKSAVSAPEV